MHKIIVTKKVNGVKITLESKGKEPFYLAENQISLIEELIDSHIYNVTQGQDFIAKIFDNDIKLSGVQKMLKEFKEHKFPVKIPQVLKYIYSNDNLPF